MRPARLEVSVFTVPAERPESDGTLEWDATTVVVVEAQADAGPGAGTATGVGYSYGHPAIGVVARETLLPIASDSDVMDPPACWRRMVAAVRNAGLPGISAHAISAVDTALWDLKARLLGVPLATALGAYHDTVPVYGSGGFTSLTNDELVAQLTGWAGEGIPAVKMKVGREPSRDVDRVAAARRALGDKVDLFVDANGAYTEAEAARLSAGFGEYGVTWLEEPVSSDDLAGLARLRDAVPGGMEIAAGEYGYTPWYFARMLQAGAVDCLQADVTRCGGITGFLEVAGLCAAHGTDLSAHCAPQLSAHACAAARRLRHLEYFHDHARLEPLIFDGCLEVTGGVLRPERSDAGNGLTLRRPDADRYRVA